MRASISFERRTSTPNVFSVRLGEVGRLITNGFGEAGLDEISPAAFLEPLPRVCNGAAHAQFPAPPQDQWA
jgi:hypothetical protein